MDALKGCPVCDYLQDGFACVCPKRTLAPADVAKPATMWDAVKRPAHYARYIIEPITFIMANKLPFAVGNVVKYILRYDAKNGKEDVRKAIRYCEMILEQLEREEQGTVAAAANRPL